jgi:hypothetical protein
VLRRLNLKWSCGTVLIVASTACGSTAVTEITGPGSVRCQTSLAAPASPVAASGAQLTVGVVAARECAWTAASEASWLAVTPANGQGEGTLTVTVAENPTAMVRAGSVMLNDSRVSVSQAAAPCRFELNRSSASAPHSGGSTSVALTTLEGCDWRTASSASWIRVMTPAGRNSATIAFEIEPNTRNSARRSDVEIAGLPFTIQQDAPPVAPPPATPPPPTAPPPTAPPPTTPPPTPPPPATPPPPPATPPPPTPPPAPPPGTTPPAPPVTPPTTPPPTTPVPPLPPLPPPLGERTDLKGSVGNLSGSCPALSFRVKGTLVTTDGQTEYDKGTCESIKNGLDVDVKGRLQLNGSVHAEEIKIREK